MVRHSSVWLSVGRMCTAGDNSQIWRQSPNRMTFQLLHVYFECTLEFLSPFRGTDSRIFSPVLCAFHVHVEKFCLKNHPMVCCSQNINNVQKVAT